MYNNQHQMMQTDYGSYLLRNWHHWNIYDPVLTSLSITTVIISRVFYYFIILGTVSGNLSRVWARIVFISMSMPQRYLRWSLYIQSQVFYPCLLIVCFKVLFECSPPFLTFELHSKIKFVTLTNALFVTMMTNGKQI